jgi:hypothetical protein
MRRTSEVAVCCSSASTRCSRTCAISRRHCFELMFEIGARLARRAFRLRSDQTKLATVCSGLRPFARQGHLIDIGSGLPMLVVIAGTGFSSAERIARSTERVSARSSPASMIGREPGTGSCQAPQRKSDALARSVSVGGTHEISGAGIRHPLSDHRP